MPCFKPCNLALKNKYKLKKEDYSKYILKIFIKDYLEFTQWCIYKMLVAFINEIPHFPLFDDVYHFVWLQDKNKCCNCNLKTGV